MEEIVSGKKEEPSATDDDPDPAEWVKSSYTYDVTAPYYEVLTETTNDVTTAYDNGVERLSSYTGASAWNTIKTQYVYDGRGSVAQELSNNNSWYTFGGALSKTAKTSYSYTPFGELLKNESSGFRFNHEYYEAATGMLNLRARQYEPAIVRFNQRDIWHGKVEMPTSQNRYLYCVNDPIGYYDRSGNRVDEDVGKPKKETTSRIASAVKKLNTTMSNVANLVDTTMIKATNTFKNNVSDAAERVGNWLNKNSKTIAQVAIGVMTVAACVGIVAASGGLAAPALGAAAPGFLETFGLNVLLGTTLTYGDNLIKQVDRNGTFIQANEKASLATRHALPYIIAGSAAGAGVAKYASTLTGGGLRPLGLKDTPFPTKALDELLGDSSSTYSGTQANGATQSGGAGTTACTEATNSLMSQDGEIFSPINPGPLTDDIANSFRSSTYTEKILTEDTVFYRVYGGDAQMVGNYMSRTPQNGGIQSQFDLGLNPTWGNTAESIVEVTVPKGTIIYEGSAATQGINGGAGNLLGGGNQIYIPEARMNAPWFGN